MGQGGVAVLLMQLNAYMFFIPSMIINCALFYAIVTEKTTKNRIKTYNYVFVVVATSNIAMTAIFALVQPLLIYAHRFVYIVMVGPISDSALHSAAIVFSLLTVLLTINHLMVPILFAFRYYLYYEREQLSSLTAAWYALVTLALSLALGAVTFVTLVNAENVALDTSPAIRKAVDTFSGGSFGYLTVKLEMKMVFMGLSLAAIGGFVAALFVERCLLVRVAPLPKKFELNMSPMFVHTSQVCRTFVLLGVQIAILQVLGPLIFDVFLILEINTGVRSIPTHIGCVYLPLTTSLTCFLHISSYRRKIHLLLARCLGTLKSPTIRVMPATSTELTPSGPAFGPDLSG